MPSTRDIGQILLDNEEIEPEESNKLREKFNENQVNSAIEQRINRLKCPSAGGKTMQESYD